jgi:hypothetical protein
MDKDKALKIVLACAICLAIGLIVIWGIQRLAG